MARKKHEITPMKPDVPVYPIGVAARLLSVHPRTLRIYEDEGLIKPHHEGSRRMFSDNDIKWIGCLRSMIHKDGISIPGLKKLLDLAPCWEISNCPPDEHESCRAMVDRAAPRIPHKAGDEDAARRAKEADRDRKRRTVVQKKKHQSSG
ncbi:MAG: MerR family transcriptional regulator [Desulfobulbaceae bacterium]|nr:MerR family transcriptional regulator [Desulfobulbaceae bacterium]